MAQGTIVVPIYRDGNPCLPQAWRLLADDPGSGRWLSVDPLSEKYLSLSPFCFTLNNPLNNRDPDGKIVTGLQFGFEIGAGYGGSFNITITFDSRGNNWDILASSDYGIMAGLSFTGNVGFLIGERYTRTQDLIGNSMVSSADLSFLIKGGGYSWSESQNKNGKASGREAHVFSSSPGIAAHESIQNTTTIDLLKVFDFSESENNETREENDTEQAPADATRTSTSSEIKSDYTMIMRDLLDN